MSRQYSSNPRPFAIPEPTSADVDDERTKASDNLLNAEFSEDESVCISEKSKPTIERQTILKPIFISPTVHSRATPLLCDDDIDPSSEASAYLAAELEADAKRHNKSFEERRIAGTPFDINSVDDTDGLDENEEQEMWKQRELERLKWEEEMSLQYEKEQAEIERRRQMTEEERVAQDREKEQEWLDKVSQQQADGEGFKFLQKYYHKGAFYQDPNDDLQKRNYIEPTGEDRGVHRDTLPAVLQVRNFGKKGRSKWTHLSAEDTTAHDYGWGDKKNMMNYQQVRQMGGMKGDLANPSTKRQRPNP
jgi:microfibrillar-associated protein 1